LPKGWREQIERKTKIQRPRMADFKSLGATMKVNNIDAYADGVVASAKGAMQPVGDNPQDGDPFIDKDDGMQDNSQGWHRQQNRNTR